MEKIIENRLSAMKAQFNSNRIEGAVNENAFNAMLDRAKSPISDKEFTFNELSRIYANFGLVYVE